MKAENSLVKVEISLRNVKVFQKSLDILNQTAISCSFLKYPQVNFLRFPLAFFFWRPSFFTLKVTNLHSMYIDSGKNCTLLCEY